MVTSVTPRASASATRAVASATRLSLARTVGCARRARAIKASIGSASAGTSATAPLGSSTSCGVAPIAVIGNDASWQQIAREQVEILGTTLGCDLRRTDYHKVAEGYGGVGLKLDDPNRVDAVLAEAKAIAKTGRPVCINVHLRKTDFRKGSISI